MLIGLCVGVAVATLCQGLFGSAQAPWKLHITGFDSAQPVFGRGLSDRPNEGPPSSDADPPWGGGAAIRELHAKSQGGLLAAIEDLSSLEPAGARRIAALSLLGEFTSYHEGVALIEASLESIEQTNFRLDAIANLALDDPKRAFELAKDLGDLTTHREGIRRIARRLGESSFPAALDHAELIESFELSGLYRNTVIDDWASADPKGLLDYLHHNELGSVRNFHTAFRSVAEHNPQRLLEVSQSLPPTMRITAESAALEVLAAEDPATALRYLNSLPYSDRREQLLISTARQITTSDIHQALNLEASLHTPIPAFTTEVLRVLADTDPKMGVHALIQRLADSGGLNERFNFQLVTSIFSRPGSDWAAYLADQLSGTAEPVAQQGFDAYLNQWANKDPVSAYDWAVSNFHRLTPSSVDHLARQLGGQESELAMQMTDRLPPELQRVWVNRVANEVARSDLPLAVEWLAKFEHRAFYQDALTTTIQSAAETGRSSDLSRVAALLEQTSPTVRADSLEVLAYSWAAHDPNATAQWLERIELPREQETKRADAYLQVASRWAEKDPGAASDWILSLSDAQLRDKALTLLVKAIGGFPPSDDRVAGAFSSPTARQSAIADAALSLASINPQRARLLIDKHITDSFLREHLIKSLNDLSITPRSGLSSPTNGIHK